MTEKDLETVILTKDKSELKVPPMYKILLLNDDFTPMDFVVEVLKMFFSMDQEQAVQIMLKVHTEGAAVCGVYPSDIASTKVNQVVEFARNNQHPLRCVMEEN
ncbi:ATP-dependent Clp protease adapter ClpS [Nitrosomonas aestuarii]|uniref:ATP-dependent Clp protease adapter protein ClpS n=1 Tax=Nitrosomonas aestuarii TaxID=52441 RepID=A0A1I4CNJ8_9PROT|nr:ATP-dependent Clp protease adapter ClpS [Nitrosomonas aestuarii]PTN08891.1 ATP-dependent Clp protease adaptor protein ClpS [Nitrosomonas aestuarii]SFK82220.1 ATP-dependent Clp protease adaptor protein ClpS [Nitrosomonas aestuarii]